MKSEIELRVNTYGSKIELEQVSIHNEIRQNLVRKIIDLEDQLIRDALIKLGWTPPKEKDDAQ